MNNKEEELCQNHLLFNIFIPFNSLFNYILFDSVINIFLHHFSQKKGMYHTF